ncbi:MAG TPA: hypothetical protein VGL40_03025 [Bacillota bacterium]
MWKQTGPSVMVWGVVSTKKLTVTGAQMSELLTLDVGAGIEDLIHVDADDFSDRWAGVENHLS